MLSFPLSVSIRTAGEKISAGISLVYHSTEKARVQREGLKVRVASHEGEDESLLSRVNLPRRKNGLFGIVASLSRSVFSMELTEMGKSERFL